MFLISTKVPNTLTAARIIDLFQEMGPAEKECPCSVVIIFFFGL